MKYHSIISQTAYCMLNYNMIKSIGLQASFLLSELATKWEYYTETGDILERDGKMYFYATAKSIEDKTCITYDSQLKIIKKLIKLKLIEQINYGLPQKRYFWLNFEKIDKLVAGDMQEKIDDINRIKEEKLQQENADNEYAEKLELDIENFNNLPRKFQDLNIENFKPINKDNINKKDNINIYSDFEKIFNFWNTRDLLKHRVFKDSYKSKIKAILKSYNIEEIERAIINYEYILNSKDYLLTQKWTIKEFFDRGFEKFLDLETAKNYYKMKGENNANRYKNAIYEQSSYRSRAGENTLVITENGAYMHQPREEEAIETGISFGD